MQKLLDILLKNNCVKVPNKYIVGFIDYMFENTILKVEGIETQKRKNFVIVKIRRN